MNKAELISATAEKAGMSKKDSEKVINALIETITTTMQRAIRFSLSASAFLKSRTDRPRTGRNPEPRRLLRFQLPRFLSLRPARHLRIP